MPDEQSFLDEVIATPHDDLPRLIYADWLEDRGDPRGEFIRLQCRMATIGRQHTEFRTLHARETELLAKHRDDWVRDFPANMTGLTFRRGFVQACRISVNAFVKNWKNILRSAPLQMVAFTFVGRNLAKLANIRGLRAIRSVWISDYNAGRILPEDTVQFAASPNLAGVEELQLPACWNEAFVALAGSPSVRGLRSIKCQFGLDQTTRLTRATMRAVCRSPNLCNLKRLNLEGCLTRSAVPEIANATFADCLRILNIARCGVSDSEFRQLIRSQHLTQLRELSVNVGSIQGHSLFDLASSPMLTHLQNLNMTQNPVSIEALRALSAAAAGSDLRVKFGGPCFGGPAPQQYHNMQLSDPEHMEWNGR